MADLAELPESVTDEAREENSTNNATPDTETMLTWNYRERVDLLTDVIVGILGMLTTHPMIPALAGQQFVDELSNVSRRLSELREGSRT